MHHSLLMMLGGLLACAGTVKAQGPVMDVKLTLKTAQVARGNDLEVTATITNRGDAPARLNTTYLGYPSLVLRVKDAADHLVPLGPPPTPRRDDGDLNRKVLAPGESATFTYRSFFGSEPVPGDYRIFFQTKTGKGPKGLDWEGSLTSDPVPFVVK
jgi:hypothetical protein